MATSFLEVLNRAFSTLDGAINNSVTTVNVAAGEGSNFPASFDYHVTVGSEIMKVTGRTTDALTVTRGAESSTPAAHSDGDTIAMVITAQHLSDLNTAVNAVETQAALARIAGSTYSTVQHLQDIFHSAGWVSGGGITDDTDGTITVAAGTGLIRATDSAVAEVLFTDWAAEAGANVNLADNDTSYIYVEYTGGTPAVFARTTESTDYNTKILLAVIAREGTTLHINAAEKHVVGDHANSMIRRMKETMRYGRVSGGIISATGTRNFGLTAGNWWLGLTEFTTAAFDSSGADRFSYFYRQVSDSGWNEVATQAAIHQTNYDDNSGTLATLSNNKYGVHWVYLETDDHLAVVYGQGDYTLAQAEDAQSPGGLPERLAVQGILVGKIILKESDAAFTQIESAFETTFAGSLAQDHGSLAGLADDDHTQYILKSLLTTRGDIIYRNATVPARLAKGTEGFALIMGANDPGWAAIPGVIENAEIWRLVGNTAINANPLVLTGTMEADDTSGAGSLGSAMSVTSGIFTFPQTGIWEIVFIGSEFHSGGGGTTRISIERTENDTDYAVVSTALQTCVSNERKAAICSFIFEVASLANDKVRFSAADEGGNDWSLQGSSTDNISYFVFKRLGAV